MRGESAFVTRPSLPPVVSARPAHHPKESTRASLSLAALLTSLPGAQRSLHSALDTFQRHRICSFSSLSGPRAFLPEKQRSPQSPEGDSTTAPFGGAQLGGSSAPHDEDLLPRSIQEQSVKGSTIIDRIPTLSKTEHCAVVDGEGDNSMFGRLFAAANGAIRAVAGDSELARSDHYCAVTFHPS
jgi:hypothetical protein